MRTVALSVRSALLTYSALILYIVGCTSADVLLDSTSFDVAAVDIDRVAAADAVGPPDMQTGVSLDAVISFVDVQTTLDTSVAVQDTSRSPEGKDVPADTGDDDDTSQDSGGIQTPFGMIIGDCEQLLSEIATESPSFFFQTVDFDGSAFDASELSVEGIEMFQEDNAGGSSKCTEVFSYEVLSRCLEASLHKTENKIVYDAQGPLTDYSLATGEASRIGVSVTRAYKGPILEYTLSDAVDLLEKKLAGVNESSDNVSAQDEWEKQVLHVWTLQADWAVLVSDAWLILESDYQADTIVLVTLETGTNYVTTNACNE